MKRNRSTIMKSLSVFNRHSWKPFLADAVFIIGIILLVFVFSALIINQSQKMNLVKTAVDGIRYTVAEDFNEMHGFNTTDKFRENVLETRRTIRNAVLTFIGTVILFFLLLSILYGATQSYIWSFIHKTNYSLKSAIRSFYSAAIFFSIVIILLAILIFLGATKIINFDLAKGLSVAVIIFIPYFLLIFHSTDRTKGSLFLAWKKTFSIGIFRFIRLILHLLLIWVVVSVYFLLVTLLLGQLIYPFFPAFALFIWFLTLLPCLFWIRYYFYLIIRGVAHG